MKIFLQKLTLDPISGLLHLIRQCGNKETFSSKDCAKREKERECVLVCEREREAEETSNEEMIESDLAKISDL